MCRSLPITTHADGVRLVVRLTPNARSSGFLGLVEVGEGRVAIGIRLAAPPVEGAANKALLRFVAKALGVSPSKVTLVSGATSRLKTLQISADAQDVRERLAGQLAD